MSTLRIEPFTEIHPEVSVGVRSPDDHGLDNGAEVEVPGEVTQTEAVSQPMYAFLDIGQDRYRWKRFGEVWEARFHAMRNGFVFDGEVSEVFYQAHKNN